MSDGRNIGGATANYLDGRMTIASGSKRLLRKVFPDHWSFMLGEIALYSFIVLLLTGIYLTLFFKPSMTEVTYHGSYVPLQGVQMSEAFASTLNISFDVRAGLLCRQMHHWATMIFASSVVVHLLRIFFTGAFRKPRELNWIIGVLLLLLVILNGFAGYSLPDDLLSGTGLRIGEGVMLAIPVVGTYLSFFFFNGEFPGHDLVPRLYSIHILLIPGVILALIAVHLILVFYQKHTQFPGPGRTDHNVIGFPLFPVYTAKAGGFFFVVFGITALLGGIAQINPVWLYGPYRPDQVSAGSQPDWYMGNLEGSLRLMPNWETTLLGHTISWNILIPGLGALGFMFTVLLIYPFLEAWITGDKREHHVLDRPRNQPTRTALGVMALTFYMVLFLAGGNDLIATHLNLSVNAITWALRIAIIVAPPIAYVITKRICLGLQRHDRNKVLHGRETGIIKRLPHGEFIEVHEPLAPEKLFVLTAHEVHRPLELTAGTDAHGRPRKITRGQKIRAKLSRWYFGQRIEKPTVEEYREITSAHGHH
jgi:ubiquinol-cytochrome c reductase cytochrome b subunit